METNEVARKTKFSAYFGVNITKARYENCLFPLAHLRSGTTKDVVNFLDIPINRISGRFSECSQRGLIVPNYEMPIKFQDGSQCTNFSLTDKGKQIVKDVLKATMDLGGANDLAHAINKIIHESL